MGGKDKMRESWRNRGRKGGREGVWEGMFQIEQFILQSIYSSQIIERTVLYKQQCTY